MATKDLSWRSNPEKKQIKHGSQLYEDHGRILQQLTDSMVRQDPLWAVARDLRLSPSNSFVVGFPRLQLSRRASVCSL
jgi:hypothetical protein